MALLLAKNVFLNDHLDWLLLVLALRACLERFCLEGDCERDRDRESEDDERFSGSLAITKLCEIT